MGVLNLRGEPEVGAQMVQRELREEREASSHPCAARVRAYVEELFRTDELNRLPDEYGGGQIYAKPLIGVARGDDRIFEAFKSAVAPEHLSPAEMWLESGLPDDENLGARLRVLSIIFPYVREIREAGGRNRGDMPPEIYCVARNFADAFIRGAADKVASFLQEQGYQATSGVGSRALQMLSDKESGRIYANWSERHVAFAAGLGTFSLHEALITQAGCNVRIGSVVTDAPLEVTLRASDDPYANCLQFSKGTLWRVHSQVSCGCHYRRWARQTQVSSLRRESSRRDARAAVARNAETQAPEDQ